MLLAAPFAAFIPLGVLATVVVVVAWNTIARVEIMHFLRIDRAALAVVSVTLTLTLLRDLLDRLPDTKLPDADIAWPPLPAEPGRERFGKLQPIAPYRPATGA